VKRLATPLLALAIFLVNVCLNAPLFMPGELPFRGSIENGYVAIARLFPRIPTPGLNPFQYCGIPTRFLYVPALPYLTAFLAHLLPHIPLAFLYRVMVSAMTCLGPVTAFFFALYFTGSRRWSLAAALMYSFLSPSYGLFPAVEQDRGIVQLPWRIQVLAKYGEGPHNTALALMPLVLLALWLAGRRRGYPPILAAALLLAATPLVNWVGAFALAIACLLLLVAALGEPGFRAWRVFAAAGLAYLLACFWLTPSFIKTIVFNWPTDSFAYQFGAPQRWLVTGLVFGAMLIRLLFRWLGGSFYLRLVTLAAFTFGFISTVFYVYGLDTIPNRAATPSSSNCSWRWPWWKPSASRRATPTRRCACAPSEPLPPCCWRARRSSGRTPLRAGAGGRPLPARSPSNTTWPAGWPSIRPKAASSLPAECVSA